MTQVVECATCGRAAVVLCSVCLGVQDGMEKTEPKRYTADEVEELILRWCGWPERVIENVRHAFKMDACGGIDRGPEKLPETRS